MAASSIAALDRFTNLRVLILDHNNLVNLRSFPAFLGLETLSLAYNTLRDLNETLMIISESFPLLRHLNLIKNPINPMFGGQNAKYEMFRAKFKVWVPSLITLDGIDFSKDEARISQLRFDIETEKAILLSSPSTLPSIPEEGKSQASAGGAAAGNRSAAAQNSKESQRSYQFNQRAYKKYHTTKSLVERILKSHSEGNRFIKNEDL